MEDKFEDLLSFCAEIDFGAVNLSEGANQFRRELNNEIILFCKSLPESTQTDALLFFMKYLGTSLGQEINFFRNYYAPAWSIIYWLVQSAPGDGEFDQQDTKNAKKAHTMAIFLHFLDDHLNDRGLPVTHLALLLRSQSWMIMNHTLDSLADGVDGGEEIVKGFIDDYYSGICCSEEIDLLDSYCDLFQKQMATWLIVPVLMTKKMSTNEELLEDIRSAYVSFGIAWRLLDDIKDIEADMMKGIHSSIYACLPENIKHYWNKKTEDKNSGYVNIILSYILGHKIIIRIKERICSELESAASVFDRHNMGGLADEFRHLLKPLKNGQSLL